ncbi:MAG: type II secretion system F family protein [Candidatus Woesearchaeota archaeon]
MGLFSNNVNTNILMAIEYVLVQHNAGYSREHIITSLTHRKFGAITRVARKVLVQMHKGKDCTGALEHVQSHVRHRYLKRFVSILSNESDFDDQLDDLADEILKMKRLTAENLIDNLSSRLQKTTLILSIPFALFFISIIEEVIPGIELISRPELDYGIYAITIFLLLLLLVRLRYNE